MRNIASNSRFEPLRVLRLFSYFKRGNLRVVEYSLFDYIRCKYFFYGVFLCGLLNHIATYYLFVAKPMKRIHRTK